MVFYSFFFAFGFSLIRSSINTNLLWFTVCIINICNIALLLPISLVYHFIVEALYHFSFYLSKLIGGKHRLSCLFLSWQQLFTCMHQVDTQLQQHTILHIGLAPTIIFELKFYALYIYDCKAKLHELISSAFGVVSFFILYKPMWSHTCKKL